MPTPILTDKPLNQDAASQALLFRDDQIEAAVVRDEHQGRYTAVRLRAKQPAIYDAVVGLLANTNLGLVEIGRLFGIHHRTVAAVRDENPEPIDMARSKRVTKLLTAADLQVERLIDNPDSAPMNVAGLIASQLYEKAELLAGRATQRIEGPERVDIVDQYQQLVAKMERAAAEKVLGSDQVREIPAGIGLLGQKSSAIEPVAETTLSDEKSDDSGDSPKVIVTDVTKDVTEGQPSDRRSDQAANGHQEAATPGGGSPLAKRAGGQSIRPPTKFSDNGSADGQTSPPQP